VSGEQVIGQPLAIGARRDRGMREQRLDLGSAEEPVRPVVIVQRLDAEPVARGEQSAASSVPDDEREHPVQPIHAGFALLLVEVEDDFAVGVGVELVSA
jgi:hypothetical protein